MDFRQSLDLSFQDKYILAFEREGFPFLSHIVIECDQVPDTEKIIKAIEEYILKEPYLRLIPNFNEGHFEMTDINKEKIKNCFKEIKSSQLNLELRTPFDFNHQYSFRVIYVKDEKKLIFTHHHSLFDGHAQFNFLKDFFDLYADKKYEPRNIINIYKFRKYFKSFKIRWLLNYMFELFMNKFSSKKKLIRRKIARLIDSEPSNREVAYEILEIPRKTIDSGARKNALSSSAYISLIAAKAADKILRDKGDSDSPMVIYIPKSMRFELKIMRHFQNLLGFVWMKIDRENIEGDSFEKKFRDTYKFRSTEDEVKKTLLISAIFVKVLSYKKLKKFIKHKEEKIFDCTLLISSGRTPKEIEFPEEWKINKLYALGSMTRSPGIGILSTSYGENDYITVEYLNSAFNIETVKTFISYFKSELGL